MCRAPIRRVIHTVAFSASAVLCACAGAPAVTPSPSEQAYAEARLANPSVCVAFSGGGVRSAAISMGVLSELYHEDLLSKVDLVSGASGGSWALLWLYSNTVREGSVEKVFGPTPTSQTTALQRAEQGHFLTLGWRMWSGFWGAARLGRSAYYADLVTTFGAGSRYTSPDDLITAAAGQRLPIPIVTLTALDAPCKEGSVLPTRTRSQLKTMPLNERLSEFSPLSKYVVEVSPLKWGNADIGFSPDWPTLFNSLEYWVMSSGAFIDYPRLNVCPTLSALGAAWGQWLSTSSKSGGRSIYAVDGGFAENLAAYPLIRRGCNLTVVIDAELDPELRFEGYQRLRNGIRAPLQSELVVPAIDKWLTNGSRRNKRSAVDPSLSLVKSPVYYGFIARAGRAPQYVEYLKLTLDPGKLSEFTKSTREYYQRTLNCVDAEARGCDFPHTATNHTNYSPGEFAAHHDLGMSLTRLYLAPILKGYLTEPYPGAPFEDSVPNEETEADGP